MQVGPSVTLNSRARDSREMEGKRLSGEEISIHKAFSPRSWDGEPGYRHEDGGQEISINR